MGVVRMMWITPLLLSLSLATALPGISPRHRMRLSPDTFGFVPERGGLKQTEVFNNFTVSVLKKKIAQFVPVTVTADTADFSESETKVLDLLIAASKYLNPVFNRQSFELYKETREELVKQSKGSELAAAQLEYFDLMRGPWDRQDHHNPFAVSQEKPEGAGYYPVHMEKEHWNSFLEEHPDQRVDFESLFTVITEIEGELRAKNYSSFFSEQLQPAHNHLLAAAILTDNDSLKTFLQSRAKAFLSNDYYQSDKDWMDLDSKIEITIGPYETYEDRLLGLKASFESFVTITDPVESGKLSKYKSLLPAMEQNLPTTPEMKVERGGASPLRVVDLVFSSGDARKSVQTLAFNLPNDERVRKEKGAKKVMLKNNIINKFNKILTPIAKTLMSSQQMSYLDGDSFFNNVLFHELSHSLGPAFVKNDESQGEIRLALGASYSGLEEAKADVMGVYNILFMIKKGELPADMKEKSLFTYISGLFRSIRFGVAEAHGKGAALQLNRYLGERSVTYSSQEGKYSVNFQSLEESVRELVRDICTWQHNGDRLLVDSMMERLATLDELTTENLARLDTIPIDIRPCYPLAGEQC